MDKVTAVCAMILAHMRESGQVKARRVLPIASIITFLGFLDTPLLIPILALYAAELGASLGTIGLIIGLYSITNTPANIFFGRLIDRVGYKFPLLAGLIGDALGMFLYSVSRLPVHLALVRMLHGAVGALIGPATMSVTADYGGRRKGRAMSLYGMALATATLVGFGLGGTLASRFGYRVVFLFGAAMSVIGAILTQLLPGGRRQSGASIQTPAGKGFEIVKGLLKKRGLIVSYCSIFAQYFTFGGVVTLLPLYVKSLGMEAFHVGMLLAIFAIMFIILQFPGGAISDRAGRLLPVVGGLSLGIISLVLLPAVTEFSLMAVATALYGTAYGLLFPSISALVAEHSVAEERGLATGIFHALLTAGIAIGAPLMGWVGGMVGVESGLALSSGVLLLALFVVLRNVRHI